MVGPCRNRFNTTRRSAQYPNIFDAGRPPQQLIFSILTMVRSPFQELQRVLVALLCCTTTKAGAMHHVCDGFLQGMINLLVHALLPDLFAIFNESRQVLIVYLEFLGEVGRF